MESQFNIKKYTQLVKKRKFLFAASAAIIATTAIVVSYLMPKVYEAKSTVFIEKNVITDLVKNIAITPSMEEKIRVLAYTMKSRHLLLKVIEDLDLDVGIRDQAGVEALINNFQKKTDIQMSKTDMFSVSFRDEDPKRARDFVNTLVRRYIEENISSKREEAYGANRFLAEQINLFKDKLDKVESEIINFRKEKDIFIALDERSIVEEITNAQERIEELDLQRKQLEAKRVSLKKELQGEKPYTATILGRKNSLQDRIASLQLKLSDMLLRYTDNYPEVIRTRGEIESLKQMLKSKPPKGADDELRDDAELAMLNPLYQQLKEELSKTGVELASLAAREQHLRRFVESKKTYLKNMPVEKKGLIDLQRESSTYKDIYEELVHRLGQSEVSKQMEIQDKASTFRVIDPAILPTKHVSPNRIMIILFGILAGLAGGFGVVFLLDYLDLSVKTLDTLKTIGLPVLAVIPSMRNPEELVRQRKRDVVFYKILSIYGIFLLAIVMIELLELTVIDDMFRAIQVQLIHAKQAVQAIL